MNTEDFIKSKWPTGSEEALLAFAESPSVPNFWKALYTVCPDSPLERDLPEDQFLQRYFESDPTTPVLATEPGLHELVGNLVFLEWLCDPHNACVVLHMPKTSQVWKTILDVFNTTKERWVLTFDRSTNRISAPKMYGGIWRQSHDTDKAKIGYLIGFKGDRVVLVIDDYERQPECVKTAAIANNSCFHYCKLIGL